METDDEKQNICPHGKNLLIVHCIQCYKKKKQDEKIKKAIDIICKRAEDLDW